MVKKKWCNIQKKSNSDYNRFLSFFSPILILPQFFEYKYFFSGEKENFKFLVAGNSIQFWEKNS